MYFEGNIMKNQLVYGCSLSFLFLLLLNNLVIANPHKTTALEQKIVEISSLQVKIIDKIDQASEKREQLKLQMQELLKEIRTEQEHFKIQSFQAAVRNSRINYNLQLIQQLQAYIAKLNQRITYFEAGNEILKFFLQQAKDDLEMIKALKDMEVDNLIDHIDMALDEYIPETKKQTINAANIRLHPPEKIWNDLIISNNHLVGFKKE